MEANWSSMGEEYRKSACSAVIKHFKGHKRDPNTTRWAAGSVGGAGAGAGAGGSVSMSNRAQAVSNIMYSLGVSGALWEDFPDVVRETLTDAFIEWSPDMSSQELSNLCYG
jgi:hypothetical protein